MTTNFSKRKVFRSSIHLTLAGSRTRSIGEESGSVDIQLDPTTKKLVSSALNKEREKTPEFVIKPRRQFVNDGETAKFKASFEGSPSTELTWSINGITVVSDDRHKIYKDNDLHHLEILKVTLEDQGTYMCKIQNPAGLATADAELEVFVRPKPHNEKSSAFLPPTVDFPLEDTEFADKEKNATLVCKFHNGIDGTAKWYKDGREVGSWQGKTSYDGRTARLVLREASKRVCGVYECIVKNTGGEAKTRALVSLLDPSVKPTPPKFTVTLCDQDLEQGEKLVLETQVEGKPRPSLKWYKDNEELGSSQDIRMEFKDGKGRLIVDNLDPEVKGSKFTCVAQNVAGQDKTKAAVNVKDSGDLREPPIFTKELQDMEVSDGDRVELSVEVKGTPPIDIVWVHNNREIPPTDPVCRMVNDGDIRMLVVPEVFPEDAGEYVCEAYNDYGDTDTFCRVSVHAEDKEEIPEIDPKSPEFIVRPEELQVSVGNSAKFRCQVDGEPPPSVQWSKGGKKLRHGQKYKISSIGDDHFLEVTSTTQHDSGQYTCTLCNPSGSISTTTLLTVGEITHAPSSPFRPVHRNRTHKNSALKNEVNAESDSSDVSSVDSEPNRLRHREKTWSPTIDKKAGVNQVDFRGVLKGRTQQTDISNSGDSSSIHHSNKIVRPPVVLESSKSPKSGDSLKNGSSKFGNSLSQTRQKFEVKSDSLPKSVHNRVRNTGIKTSSDKTSGKQTGSKVNQFLQKFEKKETSPTVTDFRSVLKPRKEVGTSLVKDVTAKTDSGSVLKPTIDNHTNGVEPFHSVKLERLKSREEILTRNQEIRMSQSTGGSQSTGESQSTGGSESTGGSQFASGSQSMDGSPSSNGSQFTSDKKPEFQSTLSDQSVKYGSSVIMECEVAGTPDPEISWTVNQKEIKQSKFFQMAFEKNIARLTIAEAFSEDEGEYTCRATNVAGQTSKSCNLHVQACSVTSDTSDTNDEPFSPTATPPKIYDISPKEFCILRGGSIEFKASFTSVPAASVKWYKNKTEIISDTRMKIDTSEHFTTLVLQDIQPIDSGRYDIVVENSLGSDTSYASLSVQDVPEKPVGEPWVSDVTLTSATLSWYGPAYDGGCPVTNYRVEYCDAEDQEWIPVTSNCVHTTCVIHNLSPMTPYFFRIFAENKHGISEPCQTKDVTVTTDRRPSALSRLTSVESDDVFTHETNDPQTPMIEYGLVSPLSPDEIAFEHREVELKSGRKFEDSYECLKEVGKGKFGSVYSCEEKATGKIWAAKIVKCREADKKKIYLEVEIMNQLKHPKILMLWDVFEGPRKIILVMEYIGGGELFERVIDDDFDLTERDCIQFMRQILDAINYMHSKNILHLDLKPENILCVKNESNKIKIIDFGLARFYNPRESTRVMFGTPEFIAPEVVNYEEIGFTTDMWSVGVICYVLLTGLSPFMGDSDAETLSNVTLCEYDFEDEGFENVSDDGKAFIENLLLKDKEKRLTSQQALDHRWLAQDATRMRNRRINTKNLKRFMARRKWQKTGNAIRALGRITSLQKLLINRDTSDSTLSLASSSGNGSLSSTNSMTSIGSQQGALSDHDLNSLKVSDTEETLRQNTGKMTTRTDGDGGSNGSSSTLTNSCDSVDSRKDINANSCHKKSMNSAFEEKISMFSNQNSGEINTDRKPQTVGVCGSHQSQHRHHSTENTTQVKQKSNCLQFNKEMVDSKAFPGDVVRFDVEYVKSANITVTWYFEDDTIHPGPRHCIQQGDTSSSLIIKDVCEDDDGEYFCKIEDNNDEEICSAELIVYGAL